MTTVWVCGKTIEEVPTGIVWELQGVFVAEATAIACCLDDRYFVGPVELGKDLPHKTSDWPGCFYPKAAPAK